MTQITVQVHDSEVKQSLQRTALAVKNLPAKVVKAEVQQARDEVATYPPELPNQRYIRTGKRGQATKVVSYVGSNQYQSKYTVESNPDYGRGRTGNPYVIGDSQGQGQAAIHQGRWKLLFIAMSAAVERIVEKGNEYFRAVIERGQIP